MSDELIDPIKVKQEMDAMINMITHPAFVEAMRKMKASPISKRKEVGLQMLTIEALRNEGVDIPAGMRLTTRYFEPGKPDILEIDPDGKIHKLKNPRNTLGNMASMRAAPVEWGGCACGGGYSFCGGAGGGT